MYEGDSKFAVRPLLDSLRVECGDSEFGYRMQAFFAHILIELGARVLKINAVGHPDIEALMGPELMLVQVKSAKHGGPWSPFSLSEGDLLGITPKDGATGYLAFLDCAEPVSWHIVRSEVAEQLVGRLLAIEGIVAMRDEQLSTDCSEIFAKMVLSARDRLGMLTFQLLARRALAGEQV